MVFFVSASCAGCAGVPGGSTAATTSVESPPPLPPGLQDLFDRPMPGRTSLTASPWGRDIELGLGAMYPAASGRDCRTFVVRAEGAPQPGLACRRADGQWAEVRLLHHDGRPVMGDRS